MAERVVEPNPKRKTSPERRVGLVALAVAAALGAVCRLQLAFTERGLYWPDEIYQSLEPAHRLVFGNGLVAWEFIDGARNWALPGFVALFMKLAAVVGLGTPGGYLSVVHAVFALVSVGAGLGAYRLARSFGAGEIPAAVGASLWLLSAPAIYFAHRAMSENASALPLVFGLALTLQRPASKPRRRWLWLLAAGASLLGIATLFRLQSAVFCVGVLVVLLARRQWRDAGLTFGVLTFWAAFYGVLDKLTWGGFFHSAFKYLQFNLVEGKAAQWGVAPFTYYFRYLWESQPLTTLVGGVLLLFAVRRAPGLFVMALAFVLLHAWTPHKELRFILPVLPVLAALVGVGVSEVVRRWPQTRPLSLAAAGLCGLAALATYRDLTFGQLGQYTDSKPQASAYDDSGPVNRLLLAASGRDDVCGLKIEVVHIAWTGGLTYLHRNASLYPHSGPPRERGVYNYVLTGAGYEGGGEAIAREGNLALVKLGPSCLPDPSYSTRLP